MSKILLIGASGTIGQAVLANLGARHDVITVGRSSGMHQADLHGLRRAVGRLDVPANFVITDGFPVDGLGVPGVAMWKGDKVSACVSAASIVAKVTRDRIMTGYHDTYPDYRFEVHKGYCTPLHQSELDAQGPCGIHRMKWDNVARTIKLGRT